MKTPANRMEIPNNRIVSTEKERLKAEAKGAGKRKRGRPRVKSHTTIADHNPAKCPNCSSLRNVIKDVRYPCESVAERRHLCNACGISFRSFQDIPVVDILYNRENP